jgi:hypothetical protein
VAQRAAVSGLGEKMFAARRRPLQSHRVSSAPAAAGRPAAAGPRGVRWPAPNRSADQ